MGTELIAPQSPCLRILSLSASQRVPINAAYDIIMYRIVELFKIMAQKILAFVAKSFDPADEAKIDPIIRLLDSFKPLGFIPQSAERSEVESVSEKVRSLIDKSDVLVGIFTQRHPIYRQFNGRWGTAWGALSGKLTPAAWSAPPWVLQESGYALKGNKALVLFRETDVEIPGLQGDLEYISFDPRNPTAALQRANEMITGLIAKAGGIKVETVVQAEVVPAKGKEADMAQEPKTPEKETGPDEGPTDDQTFRSKLLQLWEAVAARDWETAERLYEEGLNWIHAHDPGEEVFWKCFYQRRLFAEGKAEVLSNLRDLASEYKTEHLPLDFLGDCLKDLHEYDEAVKCYLSAASLAPPGARPSLEISAAETLREAKKPNESKKILLKLLDADYAQEPKSQFKILRHLYSLGKESDDKFASFAIAELALRQRPEEMSFRFSLAWDYEEGDQNHMSLYHYKIICDQDEKNAGALNNLGIALANSNLPVLAAQSYKQSYKLGETLAGSNLARKYLDAGLSEEAIALLKEAQTKENCVPEVSRTLAAVHEKIQQDNKEEEKIVAQAEEHRDFLLPFAIGYLSPAATNVHGHWSFPSGELELHLNGSELHGSREDRSSRDSPLASLFGTPKSITRIEKTQFSGNVSGRTCKFNIEKTRTEEPSGWSLLGSPSDSKIEGYILFAEDGYSAEVTELKAGKPEKYYKISKAT